MKVYTRTEWNARKARSSMQSGNDPHEAFIHHSENEDAAHVDTLVEQKTRVQDIQNFHMNGRGWSDIAYHFIVFQPMGNVRVARVFVGRPVEFVPAAQLNHNTNTLAICVYGDFTHDKVKRNTRYVIEQLIRRYPGVKTVGGHRDVVATECPGNNLYSQIPTIARASGRKVYKK